MAINDKIIVQEAAAAGDDANPNIILDLNAGDVDSYDGDGNIWYDIHDFEYKPTTNVSEHFNTVTYNGNGSSSGQAITGVGFKPDLVWVKKRNATGRHQIQHSFEDGWMDSSDTIPYAPSQAHIDFRPVSTFDSDGFTIPTNYTYNNHVSGTYVAWCFKAGGVPSGSDKVSIDGTSYATMSAAGLTDGTEPIDKLSVNTKLGFSIVKYTAPALTGDTVAHGLDQAPEMIILKSTSVTRNWNVYHKGVGLSKNLHLNTSDAANTDEYWTANSNTFSIQDYSASADWIAYCFASKRGVSKVGSYIGDGGTSNKVVTGFEPAFVLQKRTDSTSNWRIFDNVRGTEKELYPNSLSGEPSDVAYIDFNPDGFTLTNNGSWINGNTNDYIYYAVAKNTNETSLIPDTDLELGLDAGTYSGSGDWLDSSGNGNNGTITGATWEEELGNSFEFSNLTDEVTLPVGVGESGNRTRELWVNFNAFPSSGKKTLYYIGNQTANQYYETLNVDTSGYLTLQERPGTSSIGNLSLISQQAVSLNTWYHISVVYEGTSRKMYINGSTSFGNTSTYSPTVDNSAYAGNIANFRGTGFSPECKVGQFRAYSSALTQAQVRQNFNFTKPRYPNGYNAVNNGANWNPAGYFEVQSGDYFRLPTKAPFNRSDTIKSISAWVKADTTTSSVFPFSVSSSSSQADLFYLVYAGAINKILIEVRDATSSNASFKEATMVSDTDWHHIVAQLTATGVEIYLDGVSKTVSYSNSGSGNNTSWIAYPSYAGTPIAEIGSLRAINRITSDGSISKIKLYDSTLTQTEIDDLYNEGE